METGKTAAKAAVTAADAAAKAATEAAAPTKKAAKRAGGAEDLALADKQAKEFGVLGRAMSLAGLVAPVAADNAQKAAVTKTADNTTAMAATLGRMEKNGVQLGVAFSDEG